MLQEGHQAIALALIIHTPKGSSRATVCPVPSRRRHQLKRPRPQNNALWGFNRPEKLLGQERRRQHDACVGAVRGELTQEGKFLNLLSAVCKVNPLRRRTLL